MQQKRTKNPSCCINKPLIMPQIICSLALYRQVYLVNYKQRVISVYINYGSRPSPHCVFMFHGCITSWDVKYLLWHVPVTLISPINRCNFLLLPWKIAGKCDQSAGYRRQPAAILNPVVVSLTMAPRGVWEPNLSSLFKVTFSNKMKIKY